MRDGKKGEDFQTVSARDGPKDRGRLHCGQPTIKIDGKPGLLLMGGKGDYEMGWKGDEGVSKKGDEVGKKGR